MCMCVREHYITHLYASRLYHDTACELRQQLEMLLRVCRPNQEVRWEARDEPLKDQGHIHAFRIRFGVAQERQCAAQRMFKISLREGLVRENVASYGCSFGKRRFSTSGALCLGGDVHLLESAHGLVGGALTCQIDQALPNTVREVRLLPAKRVQGVEDIDRRWLHLEAAYNSQVGAQGSKQEWGGGGR